MFNNREFLFKLDQETKMPISYQESRKMESKSLVEEYMLLANVLVAERLTEFCRDKALLRCHEGIQADKKEKLGEFLMKIGIQGVDLTSNASLSESLEKLKRTES